MRPSRDQYRSHLEALRAAALHAADPAIAVRRSLSLADLAGAERIFIVGAGKAGAAMARAAAEIVGNRLAAGVVSVPILPEHPTERIMFVAGGHPTPTEGSLTAGRAAADLLAGITKRDLVIALVSGGGSALLELLQPGLDLADLQAATNALLKCGATINEMNRIRSRLSQLKSGGFLRFAFPARVISLILSDVVGNRLDIIASGLTVPTTYSQKEITAIVKKYCLQSGLPPRVLEQLRRRKAGGEKKSAPCAPVDNRLIASSHIVAEAAAAAARGLGFKAAVLSCDWEGEARDVGKRFARCVIDKKEKDPVCIIVGGESTVTIKGKGKGGRNQEAALAAAMTIAGLADIVVGTFATDGVDGSTEAAGAIATGDTVSRACVLGLDPRQHLDDNNSYAFFAGLGDLVITGPTGTNVNDLIFGLAY